MYVCSEGGGGTQENVRRRTGGGGLFKEGTYARVIVTRYVLAKDPKYMKLSFEDYTRKVALSTVFAQICCKFWRYQACNKCCKL